MAQFDLHLIQNVAAAGIEFSEKNVNIAKGGLLSAIADGTPTVLAGGTDGYMLVRDDAEVTGLKWVAISAGHTQGTDTGTTSDIFELDSDSYKIELTAESATKFGVKVDGGATYADLQAKDATFAGITLTTGTIATAPTGATDIVNKTYADGLLALNDAMIFKGTTTIATAAALTTYNAGWTYRASDAGTFKSQTVEIGDLLIVTTDRTGSGNVDSDWTVAQTNIDGAVTGPASVTADGNIALFNGTTGKIIKDSVVQLSSLATTTNLGDYVAKSLFDANTILAANADDTPLALTVAEQRIVGRKTGGNIAALEGFDVINAIVVAAPASKTAAGTTNMIAFDDNYFYRCKTTGGAGSASWLRSPMATNW